MAAMSSPLRIRPAPLMRSSLATFCSSGRRSESSPVAVERRRGRPLFAAGAMSVVSLKWGPSLRRLHRQAGQPVCGATGLMAGWFSLAGGEGEGQPQLLLMDKPNETLSSPPCVWLVFTETSSTKQVGCRPALSKVLCLRRDRALGRLC